MNTNLLYIYDKSERSSISKKELKKLREKNNIYRKKERSEIGTNYVDISYVIMIMSRIGQIAECVITDINNLMKEEGRV